MILFAAAAVAAAGELEAFEIMRWWQMLEGYQQAAQVALSTTFKLRCLL